MFRPDVDRPTPLPASALETLQQARAAKEQAIRQQSLLRRKTFDFFDTMRDTLIKMIDKLTQSPQNQALNLQLLTSSKEPTQFRLVHPHLSVWFEIQQPGLVHISFGIPEPKPHTMFNWILRGLLNDADEISWYFFNMSDQISPDVRVEDSQSIIRFVIHEWLVNYQDYLDGREHDLDWRVLKWKSKKGT